MWTQVVFEVVVLLILGVFGLIGNVSLIGMFLKAEKKLNFHWLMILLAVYDTLLILLFVTVITMPQLSEQYTSHGYYQCIAPIAMPLLQISITGSAYCTIGVSFERYMTVCHPFYMASHKWSAKRYVLPIVVFSIVYNTSRFFEFYTICEPQQSFHNDTIIAEQDIGNYTYQIGVTALREHQVYVEVYIIGFNFLFNGLIPFSTIITLNALMYKKIHKDVKTKTRWSLNFSLITRTKNSPIAITIPKAPQTDKNESSKSDDKSKMLRTKINLILATVFILCNSIRWIPNTYELLQIFSNSDFGEDLDLLITKISHVSNCLLVLNSSVNFYIFYLSHHGLPFMSSKKN